MKKLVNKKRKRMFNILYKLRRRGIRACTKEHTIECPYGEDISSIPQVKHLRDEFHFVIQITI